MQKRINVTLLERKLNELQWQIDIIKRQRNGINGSGSDNVVVDNRIIQESEGFSHITNRETQTSAMFTDKWKNIAYNGVQCANLWTGIEFNYNKPSQASTDQHPYDPMNIIPYWDNGAVYKNNQNLICDCLTYIKSIDTTVISGFGSPYVTTGGAIQVTASNIIASEATDGDKTIYVINVPSYIERLANSRMLFPGDFFRGIMPLIAFIGTMNKKPSAGRRTVTIMFDVDVENILKYKLSDDPVFGTADNAASQTPTQFAYAGPISIVDGKPYGPGYESGNLGRYGKVTVKGNIITLTMSSTDQAIVPTS